MNRRKSKAKMRIVTIKTFMDWYCKIVRKDFWQNYLYANYMPE